MFESWESFVEYMEPFVFRFGELVMLLVILFNILLLCLTARSARKDKPLLKWFIPVVIVWILSLVVLGFFVYVERSITPFSLLGIE